MPRSKHRRKPGRKAVAHPGRGKPGRSSELSWLDEVEQRSGTSGLPLFDWADAERADRPEPQNPTEET
jgi:hypothetical protein